MKGNRKSFPFFNITSSATAALLIRGSGRRALFVCIGGGASSGELLARVPSFFPFGTFIRFFFSVTSIPRNGIAKKYEFQMKVSSKKIMDSPFSFCPFSFGGIVVRIEQGKGCGFHCCGTVPCPSRPQVPPPPPSPLCQY